MTQKFKVVNGLINDIETRKRAAIQEEKRLEEIITQKEVAYDLAELSRTDTETLTKEIDGLKTKLNQAQRSVTALTKEPSDLAKLLQPKSQISILANELMIENMENIATQKRDFDKKIAALKTIKDQYLKIVGEMGKISREAQSLANEINQVKSFIPGKEKTYFQGIPELTNREHNTDLYLTVAEIENRYTKGER